MIKISILTKDGTFTVSMQVSLFDRSLTCRPTKSQDKEELARIIHIATYSRLMLSNSSL